MTNEQESEGRSKWERSPTYPFISLKKAVDRAAILFERHRKEPARIVTVGSTWGYAPKSSGLQQTIGALKQYGLLEDVGSGDERKVQITDLARKILADQRPGAREQALKEAALKPRLFVEYSRWFTDRPSDNHCVSELVFDRGFNEEAAKTFLRSFDETVTYAGLANDDNFSSTPPETGSSEESLLMPVAEPEARPTVGTTGVSSIPLSRRLEVKMGAEALSVSAVLASATEVDRLIRILEANKALLELKEADN